MGSIKLTFSRGDYNTRYRDVQYMKLGTHTTIWHCGISSQTPENLVFFRMPLLPKLPLVRPVENHVLSYMTIAPRAPARYCLCHVKL
jgi:hypothetical protein